MKRGFSPQAFCCFPSIDALSVSSARRIPDDQWLRDGILYEFEIVAGEKKKKDNVNEEGIGKR